MEFSEVTFKNARPVDGYGPGFFRVDNVVFQGAVCVTAVGVGPWGGYEDYADLVAMAGDIDVLCVGTGAEIAHIPRAMRDALEAVGIGVETMNSPVACRTYNVILAEGRRVALVALPI